MKKLSSNRTFTFTKEEWWQLMCKEMTAFYGKSCYFIPWKVPEATRDRMERAFQIAQKENDRELSHLLNNIKRG